MYFYATCNQPIRGSIESLPKGRNWLSVVNFVGVPGPLELQIGFSFVSINNAKANLEKEMLGKSFPQVRKDATKTMGSVTVKIMVSAWHQPSTGNILFLSVPFFPHKSALRSDTRQGVVDKSGKVVNKGFNYYTEPSLWDDYRNKLVLLGMLSPTVSVDVIKSLIDKGEKTGFMPTFFHGDHAAAYIAGDLPERDQSYDVRALMTCS